MPHILLCATPRYLEALPQPQWVRCDVRKLDMKCLGKFGVIMADPPWQVRCLRLLEDLSSGMSRIHIYAIAQAALCCWDYHGGPTLARKQNSAPGISPPDGDPPHHLNGTCWGLGSWGTLTAAHVVPHSATPPSRAQIHQDLPYGTMEDDEMRALDIGCLQDDGVIFLWVTGAQEVWRGRVQWLWMRRQYVGERQSRQTYLKIPSYCPTDPLIIPAMHSTCSKHLITN